MKKHALSLFFALLFLQNIHAQEGAIYLKNPSFEGRPATGETKGGFGLDGWFDCGFEGESAPDVHPAEGPNGFFNVNQKAQEGSTYIGMVARDNGTWEGMGQSLTSPLRGGTRYDFSIYSSRSPVCQSLSHISNQMANYDTPCVLHIWAGNSEYDEAELLAESPPIYNTDWTKYFFKLSPSENYRYMMFEIYYGVGFENQSGNLLLDNASHLVLSDGAEKPSPLAKQELRPRPEIFEFTDSIGGAGFQISIYDFNDSLTAFDSDAAFAHARNLRQQIDADLEKLYKNAGRGEYQEVCEDLWEILSFAKKANRRSGGHFDVTMGGLHHQWKEAAAQQTLPNAEYVEAYLRSVSPADIGVTKPGLAKILNKNVRLDLEELIKAHLLDEMRTVLREAETTTFRIGTGNMMTCEDHRFDSNMWSYERPRYYEGRYGKEAMKMTTAAIATAGDEKPIMEFEDKKYYDFIQPKTGMPITEKKSSL